MMKRTRPASERAHKHTSSSHTVTKQQNSRRLAIDALLGLASLYFYAGYYSGMRWSYNHFESLNPVPRGETEEMRLLIEKLPEEVAALRLSGNAEMEPAMKKIAELMKSFPSKWWYSHLESN
jgi:hypothetical protein